MRAMSEPDENPLIPVVSRRLKQVGLISQDGTPDLFLATNLDPLALFWEGKRCLVTIDVPSEGMSYSKFVPAINNLEAFE